MAIGDPTIVACPEDVWTQVATNEIFGNIQKMSSAPHLYLYTYRLFGSPAPTLETEGVPIFSEIDRHLVIFFWPVDVYIWCVGDAGQIRRDFSG